MVFPLLLQVYFCAISFSLLIILSIKLTHHVLLLSFMFNWNSYDIFKDSISRLDKALEFCNSILIYYWKLFFCFHQKYRFWNWLHFSVHVNILFIPYFCISTFNFVSPWRAICISIISHYTKRINGLASYLIFWRML